MAIEVSCESCFHTFKVKDQNAGKRGKCPECGETVVVPKSGAQPQRAATSSSGGRREPSSRRSAARKSSGNNNGLMVFGICTAVTVLIGVVGLIAFNMGDSDDAVAQNDPPAQTPSEDTSAATETTQIAANVPSQTNSNTKQQTRKEEGTKTPNVQVAKADTKATTPQKVPSQKTTKAQSKTDGASKAADTKSDKKEQERPKAYASVADLIEAVDPSVVRINVALEDGGGALGSGFVIDKQGTVVTNYHVIAGATTGWVDFFDKSQGKILGILHTNPKKDIAVLKIDAPSEKLHPIRMASKRPRKGEVVVAFGAPQGLDWSNTQGIVSAIRTKEELFAIGVFSKDGSWIQTDTPISGGNSGGPLVNMRGEVVGANTFRYVPPNSESLNFAISSVEIIDALTRTKDEPVALSPKKNPKVKKESLPTVDETESLEGKRLLARMKKVHIRQPRAKLPGLDNILLYIKEQARKPLEASGLVITSNSDYILNIDPDFDETYSKAGKAFNVTLDVQIIYVDKKNQRLVKIWENTQPIGKILLFRFIDGKIPRAITTKVASVFRRVIGARKNALRDVEKAEASGKPDKKE